MTPRELNIHIEEFYEAKAEEIKERRYLAYMTAKLPLYKKFPKTFEKAFGYEEEKKKPDKPQTQDEMFNVMLAMNKALGGTIY